MTGSTAAIVRRWSDHGCSAKIKMRALRRSPSRNLDFDAVSSNPGVVTAAASGSNVTLTGVSVGRATVTVTATDPDGLSVQQPVSVSVEPSGSAPVAVGDLPGRSLEVGGVAIFDARALLPRPRGCRPELRRGHVGPNPDSARRCPPSDPATVPRPSAPPRTPRCPRPSLHPLQPLRRCSGPSPMPPAGNPPAIPCRQGRGSADQVLPSLSHVARSGVSERSPTLLDSRQWSCPCLLSVPVPTQGPFPRRALPRVPGTTGPSATLPARPAPRGVPVAGVHGTDRASRVATPSIFPACRRHYPGGNQPVVPSLSSRPVGGLPLVIGGSASASPRFEACSAFTSRFGLHGR